MAWMAGCVGPILAVGLLGCTRICQMGPENGTGRLNGTYRQPEWLWAGGDALSPRLMIIGLVMIAVSVRREDRVFTLIGDAPDWLSRGARRVNGARRLAH